MKRIFTFIVMMALATACIAGDHKELDWNEDQINWMSFDEGIKLMKQENKKGILLLYADWCSTCAEYSTHFKNKKIVKLLSELVVMKVNVDASSEASQFTEYDGKYVPKTIGLNSNGEILKQIYKENGDYMFFVQFESSKDTYKFIKKVVKAKNI